MMKPNTAVALSDRRSASSMMISLSENFDIGDLQRHANSGGQGDHPLLVFLDRKEQELPAVEQADLAGIEHAQVLDRVGAVRALDELLHRREFGLPVLTAPLPPIFLAFEFVERHAALRIRAGQLHQLL